MEYLDKLMESCPRCSSAGQVTGMGGDINLCPECKGDGVVPVSIEAGAILELWSMISRTFENVTERSNQ